VFPSPEIPRKLDALKRHCETEGRNYEEIQKACMWNFEVGKDGSGVRETIERLRWLAGMGIDTVLGPVNQVKRITAVDVMGREIILAVRDLWQWKGGRPDLPTLNRFIAVSVAERCQPNDPSRFERRR
jgi:hypothetical protein